MTDYVSESAPPTMEGDASPSTELTSPDEEVLSGVVRCEGLPPLPLIDRQDQRAEWLAHFLHSPSSFHTRAVHRAVDERGLRGSLLRSLYWRLFLRELSPNDLSQWSTQIAARRAQYDALCRKHGVTPVELRPPVEAESDVTEPAAAASAGESDAASVEEAVDLRVHNPLSPANLRDMELSSIIRHDLHRTHADSAVFSHSFVQRAMYNILFLWSKEIGTEEDGRYRQGMNELLAPLILVVLRESEWRDGWPRARAGPAAPLPPNSGSSTAVADGGALLAEVLDRRFVEHDTFWLFCRVLAEVAQFFVKVDTQETAKPSGARKPRVRRSSHDGSSLSDQTPIHKKCHYMHHILLSTLDPALYGHLQSLEVSPLLYLLRWYRCMLAREFHMEDTLVLWDVIFATQERIDEKLQPSPSPTPAITSGDATDKEQEQTEADKKESAATDAALSSLAELQPRRHNSFVLTEYVCISMLLYVRSALLHGDQVFCLRRLLRYPPVEDVRVLLARALHLLHSWKLIVSDPTLTRELFDPTHVTEAERRAGSGHGFEGPWQRLTEGMEADAPIEDEQYMAHKPRTQARQEAALPPHVPGPHPYARTPSPSSSQSAASTAKSLLSDGLSSLRSFMKNTMARAEGSPPASSPPPPHANGAPGKKYATLPHNAANRALPQTSGVSHFLAPSGVKSSSSSSSSASPPAVASGASSPPGRVGPPTAQEHDQLVLLRRQLAKAESARDDASVKAHALAAQLDDSRTLQRQMGALMSDVLAAMEREWEEASGQGESAPEEAASDKGDSTSIEAVKQQRPFSEDVLLRSLAELKHIKDVLTGRLALGEAVNMLQAQSPTAAAQPASPTGAATKLTSPTNASSTSSSSSQRAQVLADLAAISARQAAVASSSGGDNASSFPYNLPPPPARKHEPLFEPEAPQRDAVRELFSLTEDDALPGVYPAIHRADKSIENKDEQQKDCESKDATDASRNEAAKESDTAAAPPADDPLRSATPANASPAAAAVALANATVAAPAPATATQPAGAVASSAAASAATDPAAVDSLLSSLLSSPTGGLTGGSSGGTRAASSSLFDSSPPSSPFGSRRGGGGMLSLEEDDDSIALPSAAQFKPASAPFPTAPSKSTAATSAASASTSVGTKKATRADPFADPLFGAASASSDWLP